MVNRGFQLQDVSIMVKTLKGYEEVTASRIEELDPGVKVLPKPLGYLGLVLVKIDKSAEKFVEIIKREVPEAEKVFLVRGWTKTDLEAIVEVVLRSVAPHLSAEDSFAVRTVRRGRHPFKSIDVNIEVGAALKEKVGASVNLDNPDKVVFVEILGSNAYVGIADGSEFPRKRSAGKFEVRPYFRRVSLVQMPYLGGLRVAGEMGVRIGREAQTFEVGELVIAPVGAVKADELEAFLKGIFDGIHSRYEIQRKTYAHKPRKVEVYVQNLYELVRERRNEPIIVFEPEGKPIDSVSNELANLTINNKRVNFLVGSREGIPSGIFRLANLTVDLCPGVTIATDLAASSALIALAFALHQYLTQQKPNESKGVDLTVFR